MSNKKADQLGMNPSTAQNRLTKDILFSLVVETGKNMCHQCGGEITRDNFSIEHKKPWLDSDNPVGLFFGLDNIAFSHLKCNVDARRVPVKARTAEEILERDRRQRRESAKRKYSPEKRREKYLQTGQ